MAQKVNAIPTLDNQALNLTTFADIPGLSISTLNGSGWIQLTYSASLYNTYAGSNQASFQLVIDDIAQPDSTAKQNLGQAAFMTIGRSLAYKLGAGQHTIKLQGSAISADIIISLRRGNLILDEPGY